jgi:hypothetical protein
VPELTRQQLRTRERVEDLIGLMAPVLDMVLVVGERISRMVEPEDYEYYPVRSKREEGEDRGEAGMAEEPPRAGGPTVPSGDGDRDGR